MNRKLTKRVSAAREEGFTLIELLIVIVILGILAGIVTFGVAQFRTDSTSAACKADKKNVETALAAYNAKHNSYPASPDTSALVSGNYIKAAPATTVTWSASGSVTGPTC